MKIKVLALGLSGLSLANFASAEDIPSQIQQLQQQISALQTELQQTQSNMSSLVSSDYAEPLASLPSTGLNYALLQAQDQYTAPLTLGGSLDANLQTWGGSNLRGVIGSYPNSGTALALTSVDLYTLANLNNWTQAFVTVDGGLNGNSTFISEAFLNFGNLNRYPFYATVGQTYLPFGMFPGNGLVADTLDASAFEPGEINQVDLGFGKGGFNTTFAVFNDQNNLGDFVYSLQYSAEQGSFGFTGGAGYMNDIRYSESGVGTAYNFITTPRVQSPVSPISGGRNGAVDLNGSVSYALNNNQSLDFAAEWDTSTTSPIFRGTATGKMQAWTVTSGYNTLLFNKSTSFALDYSATINMHFVPLPLSGAVNTTGSSAIGIQNQWLGYVQSEVLRNVYVGPEYAWMKLYNGEHTWESTLDLSVYF